MVSDGGYTDMELYFEQLTPLVILSSTAEETGKTIEQVEDETNKALENPATTDNADAQITEDTSDVKVEEEKFTLPAHFEKEYEIYK